ncbi:hypothetical protein NQ318_008087 [Aromia moschata]|uniref:PiggyBac transposable element-derived protein domain-containing protein n=1 Tax=Aromia moschata TaxID=1265417 RepID=A0AAV8YQ07_9CUCU|nr:hypothetical protein NQ318_008087 [Aromia moschata]
MKVRVKNKCREMHMDFGRQYKRLGGDNFDDEDDLPLSHFVEKPIEWDWVKHGDLHVHGNMFPESDYSKYRKMSAIDFFELLIDNTVIDFLVDQSNKYAQFINCNDPKITSNEMKASLLFIIVSRVYQSSWDKKLYWDNGDVCNTVIYKSMRRDRFIQIMRFLHCCDNTQVDLIDKMTKFRPFLNLLKERFLNNYFPDQEICYDESMIEYYGRHGCKQ